MSRLSWLVRKLRDEGLGGITGLDYDENNDEVDLTKTLNANSNSINNQLSQNSAIVWPQQYSSWSTDPGQAINEATTDLLDGTISNNGGIVKLTPGEYQFSTDILLKDGIVYDFGQLHKNSSTEKGTILKYNGSGTPIKPASTSDRYSIEAKNFYLYPLSTSSPSYMMDITGVERSVFRDIRIEGIDENGTGKGISLLRLNADSSDADGQAGYWNKFYNVNVKSNDEAGSIGMALEGAPEGGGDPNAFYFFGCDNAHCEKALINEYGAGVYISGGNWNANTTVFEETSGNNRTTMAITATRHETTANIFDVDSRVIFLPSMISTDATLTASGSKEPSIWTNGINIHLNNDTSLITVGDTGGYDHLNIKEAFDSLKGVNISGNVEIRLYTNITESTQPVLYGPQGATVTLELNGHTWSYDGTDNECMLIQGGANLVIQTEQAVGGTIMITTATAAPPYALVKVDKGSFLRTGWSNTVDYDCNGKSMKRALSARNNSRLEIKNTTLSNVASLTNEDVYVADVSHAGCGISLSNGHTEASGGIFVDSAGTLTAGW